MATGRYYASAAVAGCKIYVFGGLNKDRRKRVSSSVEVFDVLTGVWEAGPLMGTERMGACAATVAYKVVPTWNSLPGTNMDEAHNEVTLRSV